jgi:MSHA biogenesis protein MshK
MTRLLAAAMMACGCQASATAQVLADPTRPPVVSTTQEAGSDEQRAAGPRLQSILLSSSRKIAVIDGQPVGLGGKTGSAVLIRISPSEVVLRDGDAETTLTLFPDVNKKARVAAGSAATGGKR